MKKKMISNLYILRHLNRRKNEKYSRMNVTVELDKEIYTWAVFILNLNFNNWYGLAKYIWFGIIISLLLFLKRFFVLFYIYFILYMSILPAHMYVILCSCFQWRPEEVVVTQEKNFFELPCRCWEFYLLVLWKSNQCFSPLSQLSSPWIIIPYLIIQIHFYEAKQRR